MVDDQDDAGAVRGKWLAAAEEMRQRIESGRWKSGSRLPSVGELCADLAVTHPTLRKAMERLVGAGLVEPLARGWRVVVRGRTSAGLVIGLLRRCQEQGAPLVEADREAFFRRALELEASRRGLRIESWGIDEAGNLYRGKEPWTGNPAKVLAAVVVSLWHMREPTRSLSALNGLSIPVAIWDERSNEEDRPEFPRVRWFRSGLSEKAGSVVGRHLVDQRHRHIGWISPFQGSLWSTRRQIGLAKACAQAVPAVALHSFVLADRWAPEQYTPDPEVARSLMEPLVALTPGALRSSLEAVVESGQALLRDRELLLAMDGLFEKALRTPGLTAWVCANDDVARIAWNWLDDRGVAVGRDLALVGFDNTMAAQTAGLTSMSFLEDDLASGMVSYLLDPGHWRSNGVVSLVGSLVVRGSSGVPRPMG